MTHSRDARETAAEIIALRMREYDSLRNEIQQRVAARTEIAGDTNLAGAGPGRRMDSTGLIRESTHPRMPRHESAQ